MTQLFNQNTNTLALSSVCGNNEREKTTVSTAVKENNCLKVFESFSVCVCVCVFDWMEQPIQHKKTVSFTQSSD